jgi:hypothetical protein
MNSTPLFEKKEENLDFFQLQEWGEQKVLERQKNEEEKKNTYNDFIIIDEERLRYLSEK